MIELIKVAKGYSVLKTIIEVPRYRFERGEMVSLVGPNGCGKSTLLMIMAGLLAPTKGRVDIDDHEAGSLSARGLVSFIPDKPALFDDLTVAEQMAYVARLNNLDRPYAASDRLMNVFGAEDLMDRFPRSLSKGQRQKAGILVATSRPFDALLLDEPTSGLDNESHNGLIDELGELANDGKLIIASTHNDELIASSTRVARIANGLLTEDGVEEE